MIRDFLVEYSRKPAAIAGVLLIVLVGMALATNGSRARSSELNKVNPPINQPAAVNEIATSTVEDSPKTSDSEDSEAIVDQPEAPQQSETLAATDSSQANEQDSDAQATPSEEEDNTSTAQTDSSNDNSDTQQGTPENPYYTHFSKGGAGQQGAAIESTSLASEVLPPGTCTYTFTNSGQVVTDTNRSVERGCIGTTAVSLFPYSSDYWYFDSSYRADDGSVIIAAAPQWAYPIEVVRAVDTMFTKGGHSANAGELYLSAKLNKSVPGACTYTIYTTGSATPLLNHENQSTAYGSYVNSGSNYCNISIPFTAQFGVGSYTYTIDFAGYGGYVTATTTGSFTVSSADL